MHDHANYNICSTTVLALIHITLHSYILYTIPTTHCITPATHHITPTPHQIYTASHQHHTSYLHHTYTILIARHAQSYKHHISAVTQDMVVWLSEGYKCLIYRMLTCRTDDVQSYSVSGWSTTWLSGWQGYRVTHGDKTTDHHLPPDRTVPEYTVYLFRCGCGIGKPQRKEDFYIRVFV